eukprot:1195381-Prorocentrum_minimum.AAC.2
MQEMTTYTVFLGVLPHWLGRRQCSNGVHHKWDMMGAIGTLTSKPMRKDTEEDGARRRARRNLPRYTLEDRWVARL